MEKQSEACSGSHCLSPPQGMSPVWLTFLFLLTVVSTLHCGLVRGYRKASRVD